MLYGEYLRKRASHFKVTVPAYQHSGVAAGLKEQAQGSSEATSSRLKEVEDLSFVQGGAVGSAQTLALFPGISRSGTTVVGGLLSGLIHEDAARFSFMLATPVIGLAALLKVPDLLKPEARDILYMTLPAALLAGVTAYGSVRFLMCYFETNRLSPFGYYCVLFGAIALPVLGLRG